MPTASPVVIGRYVLFDEIAAGGMATVHLGRLQGSAGFARTVAIKRLHPMFTREPDFVAMLLDEARLASRIRHPNVVPTLDVVAEGTELCLVMEYVHGVSLSVALRLNGRGRPIPPRVALSVTTGLLHGLHAAHEATSETGEPLRIVHRDVSPHNVMIGRDGTPRVVDFGIAKASGQLHTTREGTIKGKLAYMAPEQIEGRAVDARTDVYAATLVLWECLTGRKLFEAENDAALLKRVLAGVDSSSIVTEVASDVTAILRRGLARDPQERFASAHEMAIALEKCAGAATATEVSAWIDRVAAEKLRKREAVLRRVEGASVPAAEDALDHVPKAAASAASIDSEPRPRAKSDAPTNAWPPGAPDTRVSMGRDVPAQPPKRRTAILVGALAGVAVLGVAAAVGLGHRSTGPAVATTASSAPAATSAPVVLASATAPTTSTPPPPVAPVLSNAILSADTTPEPSATPTARRPAATAPPRPPSRCNPPFFVDADGIRRIKPGCGQGAPP